MEIKETFYLLLNYVVTGINLFGIGVVVWGFIVAASGFIQIKFHRHGVGLFLKETNKIRSILGVYILFGLELMIAGDIIHTFIKPTQEDLIILGAIVAIRTVISFFLGREIEQVHQEEKVTEKV